MDKVTIGNAELYYGDCLDFMGGGVLNNSIGMICTDPPYGMNYQSNYRKNAYAPIVNDNSLTWLKDFASEAFRVAKNNTAHYIFCSFHNIDIFKQSFELRFKIKDILVWEKNNTSMGDLTASFAPKVEFILFMHKGRKRINGSRDPNIFRFNRTGNKFHPTQKPVDMIQYLISKFSSINDIIFDPFMGSGTTGVACHKMNRKFIGIEKEKKYFDIACKRIREAQMQPNLF